VISLELKKFKRAYFDQRGNAAKRGVGFDMSFDEWLTVWESSGHLAERGCRKGQYAMSRIGDVGPYSVSNVFIQLHADNVKDFRNATPNHQVGVKKSDACRKAMSKPQTLSTCPHCGKVGGSKTMPRWHFENCKYITL
jgi:hypothetical protein